MADEDRTQPQIDEINLPGPRLDVAFHAAAQIEVLGDILRREIANDDIMTHEMQVLCKGLLIRIKDMNSVVLSVLGGDDGRETRDMFYAVHGEGMGASHG